MENIQHFAEDRGLNKIENKIFELHNEKLNKQKSELDQELVEINDFLLMLQVQYIVFLNLLMQNYYLKN